MNNELKKAAPALMIASLVTLVSCSVPQDTQVEAPVTPPPAAQETPAMEMEKAPAMVKEKAPAMEMKMEKAPAQARMVMVHSSNWEFTPNVIRLKKGENVSLHLMGMEGNHGFKVPGLGVSASMGQGEMNMVKIPTDKAGSFEFFCNIQCGAGHDDMRGTILIE